VIFFLILQILASASLFFSLSTAFNLFKIKPNDALISRLISALILLCCLYLSTHSVLLFVFYGTIVSLVNIVFFSPRNATLNHSALSVIFGFLFWPQFLCFFAFATMFSDEIAKSDFFKNQ